MEWFLELLKNPFFVSCAMAVIIFALTQVLKLPIKHFTKKIKNERVRRMVNATILLIPFALGVLADFLYSTYYLQTAFTVITGLGYGTAGISLYGVIERFFKVKIENPYDSEEGQAVKELVEDVSKDKKVDVNDKDAVKDFWNKVK
jgi:archaellum biogenesis protein FlaJ (TadC family)